MTDTVAAAASAAPTPFVAPSGAGMREVADSVAARLRGELAQAADTDPGDDTVAGETDVTAPTEAQPEADNPDEGTGEDAEAGETIDESDVQTDPEEPGQKPETHTVKVDGEEVTVTLDELLKGYSRTEDYKRKTARLAEDRTALETERKALADQTEKSRIAINAAVQEAFRMASEDALLLLREQNTDWVKLSKEDPTGWAERKQAHEAAALRVQGAMEEQKRLAKDAETKATEATKARVAKELELTREKIPEFKDAKKGAKLLEDINGYLTDNGFKPEELDQLNDHRLIVVARDAMLYRQTKALQEQAERKKAAAPAPTVINPKRTPAATGGDSEKVKDLRRIAKTSPNLRARSEAVLALAKLGSK